MRGISEFFAGVYSLIAGLWVTIKAFFNPIVTVQYPREVIKITPTYRGHTELLPDLRTGKPKCIACGMCARSCPSGCIKLVTEKPPGSKKKVLKEYHLDFTKCSLCGLCVDVCPVGALDFSQDYNLAGYSREDFHYELVSRLQKQVKLKESQAA